MVILGPLITHRCEAPWVHEVVKESEPGVFGTFRRSEVTCSCGQVFEQIIDPGPFGTETKLKAKKRKNEVIVQETMTIEAMLGVLGDNGYEIQDRVILSPIEVPEGQMLVTSSLWQKRQQEIESIKDRQAYLFKWMCYGWTAAVIEMVLLLIQGVVK